MPAYNTLTKHANAFGQILSPESGLCLLCAQVRKIRKYRSKWRPRPQNSKIRQEIALQQKVLKFFRNISLFYKKIPCACRQTHKKQQKSTCKTMQMLFVIVKLTEQRSKPFPLRRHGVHSSCRWLCNRPFVPFLRQFWRIWVRKR